MQSIDGCFTLVIKNTLQIGAGLQEAREVKTYGIPLALVTAKIIAAPTTRLPLVGSRGHALLITIGVHDVSRKVSVPCTRR
jgi:hypothetical protein